MRPVFNGTPEETVNWLKENQWAHEFQVCIGETMRLVPVTVYLAGK